MAKNRPGRKKGGHNRGYFYRKGRGWYAIDETRQIPLKYEDGAPSGQITQPTFKSARRTGLDATMKEILGRNDGWMLGPRAKGRKSRWFARTPSAACRDQIG